MTRVGYFTVAGALLGRLLLAVVSLSMSRPQIFRRLAPCDLLQYFAGPHHDREDRPSSIPARRRMRRPNSLSKYRPGTPLSAVVPLSSFLFNSVTDAAGSP